MTRCDLFKYPAASDIYIYINTLVRVDFGETAHFVSFYSNHWLVYQCYIEDDRVTFIMHLSDAFNQSDALILYIVLVCVLTQLSII